MYMTIAYAYECFACMSVPDTQGDQKTASDPLELKLHTVMSCHVCAGNRIQSSTTT